MKYHTIAVASLALFAGAVSAQAPNEPKVQLDSLTISNNGVDGGTKMMVSIALPKKHIVGIDVEGSKVTRFTDDKGTDLTDSAFPNSWQLFLPGRFQNGKAIDLEFTANRKPAKGATKVKLKAAVALVYGSELKERKVENLRFTKPGFSVPAGPFSLRWRQPVDARDNLEHFSLSWIAKNKDIAIVSASVTGIGPPPDNPEVQMTFMNRDTYVPLYSAYFQATAPVFPPFTVEVSYCDKLERIIVPVELEVGLGL